MINGLGGIDPSYDMGLEGLGSLEDPGLGPVDIGSVPNTFGSMPGNTQTNTDLTQTAMQGLGGSSDVQISGLGGVPRPGVSNREVRPQSGFENFLRNNFQEPRDFVKFGTGILSLIPNPVQPFAQVLSKGFTLSDISDAVQGKGTGIMQSMANTIGNFDLGSITRELAKIATQNESPQ
tara:strand:- start:2 stop:535 length:534 start_codon:yes stop_codon:yes gene_type:complete